MYFIDWFNAVNITLKPSNISPKYYNNVIILNGDKSIITKSGLYKFNADNNTIEKSNIFEKFTK